MANEDEPTRGLEPLIGDRVVRAVRRLMARGRTELDRAARSGRDRLELRQLNKDLDHFWVRLGKTARRLVEAGEIDHPALQKAILRIDELESKIDGVRGPSDGSEDSDRSPPPDAVSDD